MMTDILDVKLPKNDAKAKTVRDYLKKLLTTLWEEGEGFSGKRPFGNSGWEYEMAAGLIKAKKIKGTLDSYGHVEEFDEAEFNQLIFEAIDALQ